MTVLKAHQAFLNGRRLHLLNKLRDVSQDIVNNNAILKNERDPNQWSSIQKLLLTKQQTIERIQIALNRIVNGTYGICLQCRRPINEERILTIPEAELCTPCHRLNERRR